MSTNGSREFESHDKLIASLREESDDFDKVIIPSMPVFTVRDKEGNATEYPGVGMIICRCGGMNSVISCEDASRLLNDGILTRLKIPVEVTSDLKSIP